MHTHFLVINNLRFDSVRVSHGPFIGLPPLTSLTGLGTAFCLKLENLLKLSHGTGLENQGVLFAYQNFHLHEGYKKALKVKRECTPEAMPARFATFDGSLIIKIGLNEQAMGAWEQSASASTILQALSTCKLAKGSISTQTAYLANHNSEFLKARFGDNDEARAIGALTASSLVVSDYTDLIRIARDASIDPVELMVALNLRFSKRPPKIREFLTEYPELQEADLANAALVPASSGYLYLEREASIESGRKDVFENTQKARAVSPMYSVTRISHMGSILKNLSPEQPCSYSFWREIGQSNGLICSAAPL